MLGLHNGPLIVIESDILITFIYFFPFLISGSEGEQLV